jgi:hypothetical protein
MMMMMKMRMMMMAMMMAMMMNMMMIMMMMVYHDDTRTESNVPIITQLVHSSINHIHSPHLAPSRLPVIVHVTHMLLCSPRSSVKAGICSRTTRSRLTWKSLWQTYLLSTLAISLSFNFAILESSYLNLVCLIISLVNIEPLQVWASPPSCACVASEPSS